MNAYDWQDAIYETRDLLAHVMSLESAVAAGAGVIVGLLTYWVLL